MEKSFALVPHNEIAQRLLALWDDNDGNSIARLIKLIPKKSEPMQQVAYHIISDIAASKGLDGEAKRLRALHDASMTTFGWHCVSVIADMIFGTAIARHVDNLLG